MIMMAQLRIAVTRRFEKKLLKWITTSARLTGDLIGRDLSKV